ncbi:hypothetical protein GLW04_02855 [Halobacillus litoralis]|uniref:Uncharacterized protein n=1 Tax=Halobacillus litoralis TaxID=45668 RepID=A0A845DR02_9BACI|nr:MULTISPECIES: hypothetical protein [Halobacillus]MYL18812.1 hypothetical protein [Halobacillus litoralis]MYL31248.1 hypothetical protein [Halobacillus halophilus]MYL39562.1 hypothetical protein [Halobacillus litoralis]
MLHQSGALTKEYFKSYIKLVLNSGDLSIEQAQEIVLQRLFGGDRSALGGESLKNFQTACEEIKQIKPSL